MIFLLPKTVASFTWYSSAILEESLSVLDYRFDVLYFLCRQLFVNLAHNVPQQVTWLVNLISPLFSDVLCQSDSFWCDSLSLYVQQLLSSMLLMGDLFEKLVVLLFKSLIKSALVLKLRQLVFYFVEFWGEDLKRLFCLSSHSSFLPSLPANLIDKYCLLFPTTVRQFPQFLLLRSRKLFSPSQLGLNFIQLYFQTIGLTPKLIIFLN